MKNIKYDAFKKVSCCYYCPYFYLSYGNKKRFCLISGKEGIEFNKIDEDCPFEDC